MQAPHRSPPPHPLCYSQPLPFSATGNPSPPLLQPTPHPLCYSPPSYPPTRGCSSPTSTAPLILRPRSSTSSSALTSLAQIGITVNLDGTLAVNSSTLSTALQTNPTAVSNLFTNATTGVAPGLDKLLITFTAPGGLIDQQVTALQGSLNNISTQQKSLNDYLAQLQSSLFSEYNAMDSMVAKLKSEQAQLTAQLAALTTNYGPVSKSG